MKYKSYTVKIEKGSQVLCIDVLSSGVRIALTKDSYNIVSIFLPNVDIKRDAFFDALLRGDDYAVGEYTLELGKCRICLYHGNQVQFVDFRGPFTQEDILNAIRVNQVDDKQVQLAKELEEAKKSLQEAQERVRFVQDQLNGGVE